MRREFPRRRVLQGIAPLAVLLAGCSGSEGAGVSTESPMDTDAPTATADADGSGRSEVDEYLSDANNYDGTTADETDQGTVQVAVGTAGNDGGFAFAPPAIRIDAGTAILWEWSGNGGLHNVVAEDGTFDSGAPVSGTDETFEYTFTESGTWLYYCSPHESIGMKGAVVVE